MAVFVLDRQGKALMPCTEKRAWLLLECGRVRMHRLVPEEFLAKNKKRLVKILADAKKPLRDAAALNAIRCAY